MRVIGVIQARFSSRRLPGKILLQLEGRPTLDHLLEGLEHCTRLDGVIIATSTEPSDDATTAFARRRGVGCYRGSLNDVAARLLHAAEEQGAEGVVRINGDSPLLDPVLVDHAVELFAAAPVDIVTNVQPRTFPRGQSVEVLALGALRRAVASMTTAEEREHVTPYVYGHPGEFLLRSFAADTPRPEVQLSVDDASDLARCAAILRTLGGPAWRAGWRECVRAYDRAGASAATPA